MKKGIFIAGNYGWLGEYRAHVIKRAVETLLGREIEVDPLMCLEPFHACYLFYDALVENPDPVLEALVTPILQDKELRLMTMGDDLLSRVFAARFLAEFLSKEDNRDLLEQISQQGLESLLRDVESEAEAQQRVQQILNKIAQESQQAKEEAEDYTEQVRLYVGLKAGVGHVVRFGEVLNLHFRVDLRKLMEIFTQIDALVERSLHPSRFGTVEGYEFGRDITRMSPSALGLPEELFWYRYATSTLPLFERAATKTENFVLVVDKSGSMDERDKTLWSRAIALELAKIAKITGTEAWLVFFDYEPFEPISLTRDFDEALRMILTLVCSGGTNIDRALKFVDENFHNSTIILITDGEDIVRYQPKYNRLLSVMVLGHNDTLRNISDKYLVVEPTAEGALKIFESL